MLKERAVRYWVASLTCAVAAHYFVTPAFPSAEAVTQDAVSEKKIVARVNGQPIYEDRLDQGVEKGVKKFKRYGMKKENPEFILRLQKKALARVIDEELVIQESQKIKVKDLDAKVDEKLEKMRGRYKTEEQFEDHLRMQNLTLQQARENLAKQVHVDEYLKIRGISEPDVPEEQIRGFYEGNPNNYSRKETVEVSHILIKVDEQASQKEKEKAYKKAENIRKEILEGKDFAEMAKKYSECNSASGGGGLGYHERGYMPKEFDEVAFSLEVGTVSDPVETKFGYHIIKVTDKIQGGVAPYEEVRDFIKKYLQREKSDKKLASHIAKLKEKATIEILLEEPKKD